MIALVALATLPCVEIYKGALARFGLWTFVACFHAACCLWYLAMYKGVVSDMPAIPCLVYVACDICNNFAAQAFWDAAGTIFGVSKQSASLGQLGLGAL